MGQSNIVKQYPMQKNNLEQTHKMVIINIGTSNTYILNVICVHDCSVVKYSIG